MEKDTCIPLFIAALSTIAWHSLVAQMVKHVPAMWETWVQFLDWEDPLEKGKATHSSVLAWRIPWTVAHCNCTMSLCPWYSLGKNIGVGSLSLLQGIFPIQELNPGLLHCKQNLYCQSHQGSSYFNTIKAKYDKSQLTSFSK